MVSLLLSASILGCSRAVPAPVATVTVTATVAGTPQPPAIEGYDAYRRDALEVVNTSERYLSGGIDSLGPDDWKNWRSMDDAFFEKYRHTEFGRLKSFTHVGAIEAAAILASMNEKTGSSPSPGNPDLPKQVLRETREFLDQGK